MKKYIRPFLSSENVIENAALNCQDYAYYTKSGDVCYDEYLGTGKDMQICLGLNS
jgi:hypothetical protein